MESNEILSSSDGKKLIIRTYKLVTEKKTNSTNNKTYSESYYSFDLITLIYANDKWTELKP